jgi:type II secretory pathway pseudopilin PulG
VNRKSGIGNRESKKCTHGRRSRFKVQGCKKNEGLLLKRFLACNLERRTLRYLPGGQALNAEQSSKGFTSIELIMVISCLAILTFAVGVQYNRTSMSSTVAADQLVADIQYVQMRAMGTGIAQSISFRVDSNDYGKYDIPGERKKLAGDIGVISTSFTGNTLIFNTLGEPTYGTSDGTIVLSGNVFIRIYGITGKAEQY